MTEGGGQGGGGGGEGTGRQTLRAMLSCKCYAGLALDQGNSFENSICPCKAFSFPLLHQNLKVQELYTKIHRSSHRILVTFRMVG